MTYLKRAWISDESRRLQRGKRARRGVGSDTQSFGSWPKGDEMSNDIPKDDD